MKIAFLNKYQDKVYRGAERFVDEVAKRLSKKHEVDIISNINYINFLNNKYDVIVPTNGRIQVFIIRLITWITGAKIVVSGQSGTGFDDRLNLLAFPDAFVALSSQALSDSKKRNPFVKLVYIPNGVDFDVFNFKGKKKNKNPIILSVGAFTNEKRHNLTIDAVSRIPNAKLIIIGGGGALKSEIVDYGKKMLGDERFEYSTVTYDKVPGFFKKADIFAFSSVPWESFGIVLVEAMAANLPVVATDDPIRREIVGDAGMFVDPTDTNAYADAIQKALTINWGDHPRKQAEKFSWDKIAKQYEELFENLITKK